MEEYDVDGDGFLRDPFDWDETFMEWAAKRDGLELTQEHIKYIHAARLLFEENGVVPPIRDFAKIWGFDRKAKPLYALFESGVMKRIAKYGGMPKPTGCI